MTDAALARAQALADPSRRAIHERLGHSARPLTIAQLAAATGLHRTAVGTHLAPHRGGCRLTVTTG